MKQPTEISPEGLRFQYLMHAGYFFYKGATEDENLNSALNRIAAGQDQEALIRRGLPIPTPEEIYEYAKGKWPADRLHSLPGATA